MKEYLIQEIGTDFGDAPFGSSLKSIDYTEEGIPVIQGRNIKENRFEWNNKLYVSEQKFLSLKRSHCKAGDLVFPKVGTIGITAIMPPVEGHETFLLSTNMMKMSVNKEIADIKYVYYFFSQQSIREKIISRAGGSSQPIFNFTTLKKFSISLPSLPTQQKIASILSTYDDLIENNLKRIALLEKSTRLLYEEWFVRLRFPGYEHTPIFDGVPKGWERKKAYDVMDIMSGGTPKTSVGSFYDGEIPFYTPKDSKENVYVLETLKTLTEEGLKNCNSKLYPKDTLFITARGTVGKINLAQKPMAMNQSCYALKGKSPVSQKYLYCAMQAAIDYFQKHAVGAVFDAIVVDTFKLIPFILPEDNLIKYFEEKVEPLFTQVENLLLQNQKLKQARDILLPKLINGEIPV